MQNQIRNFVIISHIDHGKSTLADRFLDITGAVGRGKMQDQFLDSMDLEREKGITIKMHPIRLIFKQAQNQKSKIKNQNEGSEIYIFNLIDTPGHIDFSYEISRALACCEGAVLLVDVKQGIQAQTLFNLEQAQKQGLVIIGCVNKVDLANEEQIEASKKELADILGVKTSEILSISGKTGQGVEELLEKIISNIPSPIENPLNDFQGLIFDSKYDSFSGVVAYVRVFQGEIKRGDKIDLLAGDYSSEVKEVGYFNPALFPSQALKQGEIGYIKTGIKIPDKVRVGDTIVKIKDQNSKVKNEQERALSGYKEPQPVLFLSLYPSVADEFDILKDALLKHKLNDPAFSFQIESQMALGRGFRCGFLGSLHAEITVGRLKNEFGLNLIATSPQVIFKAFLKNGKVVDVSSPALWPDVALLQEAKEPWVKVEIITPNQYFSQLFRMFPAFEITLESTHSLTKEKSLLQAVAPLREIISGSFYERLKSSTEGYASFNFEQTGYQKADLVKVDVLVAGEKEEALAKILTKEKAFSEIKKFLEKLKEILPPQQFALSLQASIGGKIIARETISALRKDVTAKLYGGDVTRKKKLLEAQKKGKQKLKNRARVNIPAQVFLDILK
ncbi:MAG: translation elongation factor 4 [Candidatus Pacebacteria bacterium]|nr:translation elongation factor 4 [Candidatus Paceibacterota bacterium]